MINVRTRIALGLVAASTLLAGCPLVPALVIGGIGTGVYVANDRRTNDAMIADQRIEKAANARIQDALKFDIVVDTSSYNRNLLLVGRAKTEEVKRRAGEIAQSVQGVRTVHNEIELVTSRMPASTSNDAAITTQVKARMVSAGGFDPQMVSVTTDGGVVYLQGLVTKTEGEAAARVASTTQGVMRVVTLFEYIERAPEPPKAAQPTSPRAGQ